MTRNARGESSTLVKEMNTPSNVYTAGTVETADERFRGLLTQGDSISVRPHGSLLPLRESSFATPYGYLPLRESSSVKPGGYLPLRESSFATPDGYLPLRESSSVKPGGYLPLRESSFATPDGYLPLRESSSVKPGGYLPLRESSSAKPSGSLSPEGSSVAGSQTTHHDSSFQTFRVYTDDCSWFHDSYSLAAEFSAMEGEVLGLYTRSATFNQTRFGCQWKISVPDGYFLHVEFDSLDDQCTSLYQTYVGFSLPNLSTQKMGCMHSVTSATYIPPANVVYFRMKVSRLDLSNFVKFRVRFHAAREDPRTKLNLVTTSSNSGYLTSPGYDGQRFYPPSMNAEHVLNLPENHTVVLSFVRFDIYNFYTGFDSLPCFDKLTIFTLDRESQKATQAWAKCQKRDPPIQIYDKPLKIHFTSNSNGEATGFKMIFTIVPFSQTPRRLQSGLFNCSVSNYASFKQHVHCNMKQECEDGKDEGGHCPFSSPACKGSVAVNDKCYTMIAKSDTGLSLERECQQQNLHPATIKTKEELEMFSKLFLSKSAIRTKRIGLGLLGYDSSMPHYYRHTLKWIDNTINYNTYTTEMYSIANNCNTGVPAVCSFYQFNVKPHIMPYDCGFGYVNYVVCESSVDPKFRLAEDNTIPRPVLSLARSAFQRFGDYVLTCPSGHVSLLVLACHVKSGCGVAKPLAFCPFYLPPSQQTRDNNIGQLKTIHAVSTFGCRQGTDVVPYSVVCDFWTDCPDNSDEDFCKHDLPCAGHRCSNGQCIATSQVCDSYNHCVDKSDETECLTRQGHWHLPSMFPIVPPAFINFNGSGFFTQTPMNQSDACPETHFRCQGQLDYCLPVYVLCNGVYDCLGHEDEAGCDQAELCPGFYRCWDSAVCLHPDHLCDGVPQCPRHDDETFCRVTCPQGCHCQGRSFVCSQPFSSQGMSDLRYLDASGSGVKPQDIVNHYYLVSISLASCKLVQLPVMLFPNLKLLDLSENLLTVVSMDVFVDMTNLAVLSLAGNPIVTLLSGKPAARASNLVQLDISRTRISAFDSRALQDFFNIRKLNISHSSVVRISEYGFGYVSSVRQLDIRGNRIREYPTDAFKTLTELQFLYSSDFRICCRIYLPEHYDEITCQSPQDEISSCEDLLRSNVYRACLWLIGVMSIVGNAGSFLFRCVAQRKVTKTGFNVFVTNLCLADLLMGVYLVMVGAADSLYRGQYLSYERSWTSSAVCKTAGFLSLLSSEVSAFIICLITLDRFIVLRFPFSTKKFRKQSALVASVLVWIAGILLAVVPLLPVTSHWEFYGQSGICIPLPITRKTFKGRDYSFGVIIVFNFILFVFIAAGQSVIYLSVRSNLLTTDRTKKSRDATIARRLLTVAVSDFACWFPIGVLGLLASAGVPIPGEVNVAVAIFVLPLNSALNPFLYTFNMVMERRRKVLELNLMKVLEAKVVTRETNPECLHGNANSSAGLTVEEALRFLGRSLVTKRTTLEEISSALDDHTSHDDKDSRQGTR
ncbi:hypothetical protein V1264_017360 [Littorina saxatilis]